MIHFGKLTIKHKLVGIIMLTSLITLLLGSLAFFMNDRYAANNTMIYIMTSQAKIIGENSTAALAFNDAHAAEETLNTLSSQEHVIRAAIFLPDGSIFSQYVLEGEALAQELPYQLEGFTLSKGAISVYEPIILDNQVIGTTYINASTDKLRNNITGYSGIMLAALIIALALALILSTLLQRTITGPILAITRFTNKVVKQQDHSLRIKKQYKDELGTVINGINNMLDQIQHRDERLEEYALTLEQKVIERTEELEDLTNQLRHQAYHDSLTNLPNRVLFYERLELSINQGERHKHSHAILYIDLDGFKEVNDKFGHASGDKLLKTVAERMSIVMRHSDTLSRLGGDEFAVILNDIDGEENTARMANILLEAISEPVLCKDIEVNVSGSIGISMYPNHSKDPVNLMKFADIAMHQAKHAGKNNYQFYQTTMPEKHLPKST